MTGEMKWNQEKQEHKSLWTKWLIACSIRWIRSNNGKMRWLLDMKKKGNNIKEIWNRNVWKESSLTKTKWEISWANKWLKKDKEKLMKKLILMFKLWCGIKIRRIMMKKKEDWRSELSPLTRTMPHIWCNR